MKINKIQLADIIKEAVQKKLKELNIDTYAKAMDRTEMYPWTQMISGEYKDPRSKGLKQQRVNTLARERFTQEFYNKYPLESTTIQTTAGPMNFEGIKFNTNYTNYALMFGDVQSFTSMLFIRYDIQDGYWIDSMDKSIKLDNSSARLVKDMLKYNQDQRQNYKSDSAIRGSIQESLRRAFGLSEMEGSASDKKQLTLYKVDSLSNLKKDVLTTKDGNSLFIYEDGVLYDSEDGIKKGPSHRMSKIDLTVLPYADSGLTEIEKVASDGGYYDAPDNLVYVTRSDAEAIKKEAAELYEELFDMSMYDGNALVTNKHGVKKKIIGDMQKYYNINLDYDVGDGGREHVYWIAEGQDLEAAKEAFNSVVETLYDKVLPDPKEPDFSIEESMIGSKEDQLNIWKEKAKHYKNILNNTDFPGYDPKKAQEMLDLINKKINTLEGVKKSDDTISSVPVGLQIAREYGISDYINPDSVVYGGADEDEGWHVEFSMLIPKSAVYEMKDEREAREYFNRQFSSKRSSGPGGYFSRSSVDNVESRGDDWFVEVHAYGGYDI
jgi:hypothetical protein